MVVVLKEGGTSWRLWRLSLPCEMPQGLHVFIPFDSVTTPNILSQPSQKALNPWHITTGRIWWLLLSFLLSQFTQHQKCFVCWFVFFCLHKTENRILGKIWFAVWVACLNKFYSSVKLVLEVLMFSLDCFFESHRELINGMMPKPFLGLIELDSLGMGSSSPCSFESSPGDSSEQPGFKTPAS